VLVRWIDSIVARIGQQGLQSDRWGVEALRKMELVPEGAEVIESPGLLPVVTVEDRRARVVVLPGPPRELQALFTKIVEPRFLATGGVVHDREEITHGFPESTLAGLLADLQARYPGTAIGSYPGSSETLVRLAGPDAGAAAAEVRSFLDELSASEDGQRLLAFLEGRRRARKPG
jgi:nicotinamide-nucleotide amidase